MAFTKLDIPKDVVMWTRAMNIWGLCRGLGWTLDSERAIGVIHDAIKQAHDDEKAHVEKLVKELYDARNEIRALKKHIIAMRDNANGDDSRPNVGVSH